ncbi:ThiJ/PfpI family-like [Bradyrhizobium lablabi]|uniref:ThiJ/PfpI family-like n=1 Tax=Bradyrhizobium lablabi TaxID=722472 RepID=A0A1M7AGU8_9BRAD|nr:type 1 glutamine amidotransferase domain-containing protein [Bradyrhizobium lablabi]SHL42021.1 ThiJ/PfpI family-like [Bradyrhizobium lablabi]
MARVLIPLPARDFDPSEAAVSWRVLVTSGHVVCFATPDGRPAVADDMMLTGRGLDPWGAIPLLGRLPLVGLLMRANRDARRTYGEMIADANYVAPQRWDAVDPMAFDGLLLPGGHRARGMREFLESEILQRHVVSFFEAEKPVAAVCHGVLLVARSISKRTGRSALWGYQTTALTWAFESSAWSVARITRFWDPNYYRTYLEQAGQPKGFMSVQQEVTRALARADDFRDVPREDPDYRRKTSGLARDSIDDETPAFVVRDRNYVSARWPGDAHTFAKTFAGMLNGQHRFHPTACVRA